LGDNNNNNIIKWLCNHAAPVMDHGQDVRDVFVPGIKGFVLLAFLVALVAVRIYVYLIPLPPVLMKRDPHCPHLLHHNLKPLPHLLLDH
jgi:hypothetical protein